MHAGSSSLTRDQIRTPCIGSVECYPLDHQGSPGAFSLELHIWWGKFALIIFHVQLD